MRRIKSLAILFIGTSIILLFVDVLLVAGIAALLPWLQVPLDLWAALALSILLLLVVIFTALLFVLAIRHMRASKVVVDEWGLRWKRPNLIKGRSLALAWHEITGFYEITAQESQGGKPVKTYVLDSPASTFSWPLREKSTAKELHASAYLTRLVVTRTGLPLRNLTSAVEPQLCLFPELEEALVSSSPKRTD